MSPRRFTSPDISPIIKSKHTRPATPATPNNSEASPTNYISSPSSVLPSSDTTEDDFSGYSTDLSHEAVSPNPLFEFSDQLEEKRFKQSPSQPKSVSASSLFTPITINDQKSTVMAGHKNIFKK